MTSGDLKLIRIVQGLFLITSYVCFAAVSWKLCVGLFFAHYAYNLDRVLKELE